PGYSWGETNPPTSGCCSPNDFNPAEDHAGPVALGVSAENSKTKGRIVVFGDVDWAADAFTQNTTGGNEDLFANVVNGLSEKENLMDVARSQIGTRTITNPLTDVEVYLLAGVSWCCVPVLVAAIGLAVWLIRRRRR